MTSATYGFFGAGPGRACTDAPETIESKPPWGKGLRFPSPTSPPKATRRPLIAVSWGTHDSEPKPKPGNTPLDHSFLPPVQMAGDSGSSGVEQSTDPLVPSTDATINAPITRAAKTDLQGTDNTDCDLETAKRIIAANQHFKPTSNRRLGDA